MDSTALLRTISACLPVCLPDPQEWMLRGTAADKPKFLSGRNALVWSRHYSAHDGGRCDCEQLGQVLGRIPGAARMVVGHTIQEGGITSACQGRVLRIDVGLSRGCGDGSPEVRRWGFWAGLGLLCWGGLGSTGRACPFPIGQMQEATRCWLRTAPSTPATHRLTHRVPRSACLPSALCRCLRFWGTLWCGG
jgi:hypothetical protein